MDGRSEVNFFSPEDRARMRAAAQTEWGKAVVAQLEASVAERLEHSLEIPAREAGHYHHYFCPDHKRLLDFNWESPHRHYCPECGTYLEGERYDNAWRVVVHARNALFMRECALLSILEENPERLQPVRTLLVDYASRYPDWEIHGHDMQPGAPYGGRMISQTLDEAVWLTRAAPAYLETRSLLTPDEDVAVRDRLLRAMADTVYRHRGGGNWQVWHNAGIACAAIALEDDELLDVALHDPKCGYDRMMETGVTAEGWWNERSPGYHFYPLEGMVLTAEAVRCRDIDLYDERLERMLSGMIDCVYADLTFPAHNDGWHGVSLPRTASLYELAALRYDDPRFLELLGKFYTDGETRPWTALIHGREIPPNPSPLDLKSCVYPDTGIAYLRSGQRTVVLKFGPHGGGHGHPDKLSISIHDGRREILPDLGTTGYGVPDHVRWYRKTVAHNTMVVDEQDQEATAGELVRFEPLPDGGTVEARCSTAYDGVELRRAVTLEGDVVRDTYEASSAQPHTWDYVLLLVDPIAVPESAVPIDLAGRAGYDRIADAVSCQAENRLALAPAGAELKIACDGAFTIITGAAPGPPATQENTSPFLPCYPLIIRTEGTAASVTAVWHLTGEPPAAE